jgi:hypothetical protein
MRFRSGHEQDAARVAASMDARIGSIDGLYFGFTRNRAK